MILFLFTSQVCIMVHVGSRGLGHQVATDFVCLMERVGVVEGFLTPFFRIHCTIT